MTASVSLRDPDQLSHRRGVEKIQGKAVDMAENLLAHPVNNALSHFLQHPGIRGIEGKPQKKHEKIKGCRHQDSVKIGMSQYF